MTKTIKKLAENTQDKTESKVQTSENDNSFEAAGDDTGNLIQIDSDGSVEVIDRSRKYTVSTGTNGKVTIADENKNEVVYNKDENTLIYHSSDGNVITKKSDKPDTTEKSNNTASDCQ